MLCVVAAVVASAVTVVVDSVVVVVDWKGIISRTREEIPTFSYVQYTNHNA